MTSRLTPVAVLVLLAIVPAAARPASRDVIGLVRDRLELDTVLLPIPCGGLGGLPLDLELDQVYQPHWAQSQAWIDEMWGRFTMGTGGWNEAMGYNDSGDVRLPLARTFDALYVLAWGSSRDPSCGRRSALPQYAYCWAGDRIDELQARCGDLSTEVGAKTRTGFLRDNWTRLYMPFFYRFSLIMRASSIVHEARHAEGCSHNYGGSKDVAYKFGCSDTSGEYGAWAWHINYLKGFLRDPRPGFVTQTLLKSASDGISVVFANGFYRAPCWRVDERGRAVALTGAALQEAMTNGCGDY